MAIISACFVPLRSFGTCGWAFVTSAGAISYSGLWAADAEGTHLPAWLETAGERLRLVANSVTISLPTAAAYRAGMRGTACVPGMRSQRLLYSQW